MNKYKSILMLTDDERIEARQQASAVVSKQVGDQPNRADFDHITVSKYPDWINNLILGLVVLLLVAAFIPSAIRLYTIGSETFISGVNSRLAAMLVGVSVVLMAETAQILFSLASVVLETDKKSERLLNASMLSATVLALVGNAQVALPGHIYNPFAWLEALLPPLLVLATAYVLKQQLLTVIETRFSNERAYQEAVKSWQVATSQPEKHPRYMSALANALRLAIREKNSRGSGMKARVELMQTFSASDWRTLVNRELMADQWFERPELDALQSEETTDEDETASEDNPFGRSPQGWEQVSLGNGKMRESVSVNGGGVIVASANGKH